MTKYRHSKVKRQHHVVSALEDGLKVLSKISDVDGVIPGSIKPKSGGAMGFTFQYLTQSGFKLIGRSSGAAQEVFVITRRPHDVLHSLAAAGIIPSDPSLMDPEPPNQS